MDTNRPTAGRRTAALLLAGAGLAAGLGWGPGRVGMAQPGGRPPAARLAPPQPLDAAEASARATAFDTRPPAPKPAPPANTMPADWGKAFPTTPPSPQPGPAAAPAPPPAGGIKGWVTNGTRAVKSLVGLGPTEPPPQPRIGQPLQQPPISPYPPPAPPRPAASHPTAAVPPPFQGTAPNGAPVYAGAPAYRWYGWGTTTPGMNPLAPGGEYPKGSAGWYAQTGATPGAFPVPVANPFRPPPGHGPPAYAATAAPPPAPRPAPPPAPPAPRPIAQTPPFVYTPPPAPAPPAWRPPAGGPVAARPAPVPEPQWQPAAAAVPVARGQEPPDPDARIAAQVRAACDGLVTGVTVERAGPNRIVVSFAATTETLAEFAARAVSAIPELRPVTVDFRASLTGRVATGR